MVNITEKAAAHLHEVADQQDHSSSVRISVMGSCGFGLTADSARESDHVTLCQGIEVVVDKDLLAYCRAITLDFREGNPDGCSTRSGRGFVISAENPIVA